MRWSAIFELLSNRCGKAFDAVCAAEDLKSDAAFAGFDWDAIPMCSILRARWKTNTTMPGTDIGS